MGVENSSMQTVMILYHALGKRIVVWFPMRIDFIKGCQVGDVIVGDIAAATAGGDVFVIAAILLLKLLLLILLLPRTTFVVVILRSSIISQYQRHYNLLCPRRATFGIGANKYVGRTQSKRFAFLYRC